MSDDHPHIRIRYAVQGPHTHCSVWSAESGGPNVTHGHNGTLTFRNREFAALRAALEATPADIELVEEAMWKSEQRGRDSVRGS